MFDRSTVRLQIASITTASYTGSIDSSGCTGTDGNAAVQLATRAKLDIASHSIEGELVAHSR